MAKALPFDELAATCLFQKLEQFVADNPIDQDPIANALCTCFLESLAQTAAGQASEPFIGAVSRKYFEAWHVTP